MTKIGLLLPTREAVIYGDESGDPRPLVDLAIRAEDLGFDSVWAGDSLLARPRAEPLTLLAGVATQTSDIELGTAVLLPSLRNPEQLAQATATLDALSGGRFILGVGAGPGTPLVKTDHEFVGADFDKRASRSVEILRRTQSLWRGDGDQMFPLPGTDEGPPIWMGASGPRNLQRAGAYCDGWFPTATSPEMFRSGLAKVREAAQQAGRSSNDITAAVYLTVVIDEPEAAQLALAEHSLLYYEVPHGKVAKNQGSLAGDIDDVGEWLLSFIEAGAEHLCIRVGSKEMNDQLETLATMLDELRR